MRQKSMKICAALCLLFISALCIQNLYCTALDIAAAPKEGEKDWNTVTKQAWSTLWDFNAPKEPFIEYHGLLQRLMGVRKIEEADSGRTVVKLNNGVLTFASVPIDTEKYSENVLLLNQYLKEKDKGFIFLMAPWKVDKYNPQLPTGMKDYNNDNLDRLLEPLEQNDVNCIDVRELYRQQGLDLYDYMFRTDHHWTPEGAFVAFAEAANLLRSQYSFTFDPQIVDLNNYNIDIKEDYFLGAIGKRVGTLYGGVDDISIISPKFETGFEFTIPRKNQTKTGSWMQTLVSPPGPRNYYQHNPYALYTGGDYPLMTVKNLNSGNNKKVLLLKDSFGCAFTPFLALTCEELHVLDLRHYEAGTLKEYIDRFNPDVVMCVYSGNVIRDDIYTFGISQEDVSYAPGNAFEKVSMSLMENITENFMQGLYYNYRFGSPDDLVIDYTLPGVDDWASQYRYHGMFYLPSLVSSYTRTGDEAYARAGIDNILAWMNTWTSYERGEQPKYVWHDDATARRCYHVTNAFVAWQSIMSEQEKQTILDSLAFHAELLASDDFYTRYQNHGLYQDQALYHYATKIQTPESGTYQQLVKKRVLDYCETVIAPDGTVSEHPVSYQTVVADLLYDLVLEVGETDPGFSAALVEKLDMMADLSVCMTDPKGEYFQLGDCVPELVQRSYWMHIPEYAYVATKGEEGTQPPLDIVMPDGNNATLRKEWSFDGSADWISFNASAHTNSHKHVDELSFTIWHNGPLFDEAGYGSYQVDAPNVAYSYSGFAHNIMIPNYQTEQSLNLYNNYRNRSTDLVKETTRFTDVQINQAVSTITGVTERYPGIRQTRTLIWDKRKDHITIKDFVVSQERSQQYLFLYRLAAGVVPVEREDGSFALMRGEKQEAVLTIQTKVPLNVRLIYGDEDPLIKGWDSKSDFEGENPDKIWIIAAQTERSPFETTVVAQIELT